MKRHGNSYSVDQFIEKAVIKHGNKYDYSPFSNSTVATIFTVAMSLYVFTQWSNPHGRISWNRPVFGSHMIYIVGSLRRCAEAITVVTLE